jgi:hypothetical protein
MKKKEKHSPVGSRPLLPAQSALSSTFMVKNALQKSDLARRVQI